MIRGYNRRIDEEMEYCAVVAIACDDRTLRRVIVRRSRFCLGFFNSIMVKNINVERIRGAVPTDASLGR